MPMRVPRNFLRDRVRIEEFMGAGARGAVYAPGRDVRASVHPTTRSTTDAQGRVIQASLAVVVRPEESVPVESRVMYQGQRYRVTQSDLMPDDARPSHREMYLSRMG